MIFENTVSFISYMLVQKNIFYCGLFSEILLILIEFKFFTKISGGAPLKSEEVCVSWYFFSVFCFTRKYRYLEIDLKEKNSVSELLFILLFYVTLSVFVFMFELGHVIGLMLQMCCFFCFYLSCFIYLLYYHLISCDLKLISIRFTWEERNVCI